MNAPPRKRQTRARVNHVRPDSGKASSLLDVLDGLLNKGVVLDGEVVLGLANVDLINLRLSALFAAADRIRSRGKGR